MVVPARPVAIIQQGGVVNVTAGRTLVLTSVGSACPGAPATCTRAWVLDCNGGRAPLRVTGTNLSITTGPEDDRIIDTSRLAGLTCTATLTVVDALGVNATATTRVQVSAACACARA